MAGCWQWSSSAEIAKLKFAMALEGKRRHYRMDRINLSHFVRTAALAGISESEAKEVIDLLLQSVHIGL